MADRSIMHPKFELTGIQNCDLQMMDSIFSFPGMPALTTEPSGT